MSAALKITLALLKDERIREIILDFIMGIFLFLGIVALFMPKQSSGSQGGGAYGYPCNPEYGISDGTDGLNPDTYEAIDYSAFHSGWGPRNCPSHGTEIHDGIDLACPMNSELYAVCDGTVTLAGYTGGYQYAVGILAGDGSGNWFFYAHMNSQAAITVKVGDTVTRGQLVGHSGDGLGNYAAHLHFGAHKTEPNNTAYRDIFDTSEGATINPWPLINPANNAGSGSGTSGDVESWRPDVIKALAANGLSTDDELVNKVLRQIKSESGGDNQIVQGITDVNSGQRFDVYGGVCPWCPSGSGMHCGNTDIGHGLMQTIVTTFDAYKHPGHENVFDGYDNLLSALNYAKGRYGNNLDGLGDGHGY